ncbi:hypothetical protein AFLA_005460 [Aspergillus flavus NRRL3357]|nr:hypothetical protein AFLA_005460 [Aspergillus flavus NRRL3357]
MQVWSPEKTNELFLLASSPGANADRLSSSTNQESCRTAGIDLRQLRAILCCLVTTLYHPIANPLLCQLSG